MRVQFRLALECREIEAAKCFLPFLFFVLFVAFVVILLDAANGCSRPVVSFFVVATSFVPATTHPVQTSR